MSDFFISCRRVFPSCQSRTFGLLSTMNEDIDLDTAASAFLDIDSYRKFMPLPAAITMSAGADVGAGVGVGAPETT